MSKNYEDLNFNVPNTHLLLEFVYHVLPALKNTHFCRSGPFESHHQQVKRGHYFHFCLFYFFLIVQYLIIFIHEAQIQYHQHTSQDKTMHILTFYHYLSTITTKKHFHNIYLMFLIHFLAHKVFISLLLFFFFFLFFFFYIFIYNCIVLRDFRLHGITKYERTTLNEITHQEGLRFLMQGGRWGPNLEHCASPELLSTKGSNGKEHEIFKRFKLLPSMNTNDTYTYDSPWRPASLLYVRRNGRSIIDRSQPSKDELKALQTAFETYFEDSGIYIYDTELYFQ